MNEIAKIANFSEAFSYQFVSISYHSRVDTFFGCPCDRGACDPRTFRITRKFRVIGISELLAQRLLGTYLASESLHKIWGFPATQFFCVTTYV